MPSPPTDLQPIIVARASELFQHHGYAGTSIKQIAQAAGCTNAALYYYFPSGKAEILREVVRVSLSDIDRIADIGDTATSLHDFLLQFGNLVGTILPGMSQRIGWLMVDFVRLQPSEQQFVQSKLQELHQAVRSGVSRFVANVQDADQLAWLVICLYFGYEQIFLTMSLAQATDISLDRFAAITACIVAKGA
jgi:AcrR family transcriptional regulator